MAERTFRTAPPYPPGRPVGSPPTARRWRRSADADGPAQTTLVGAGRPTAGADLSARAPTGRRAFPHRRASRADLRGNSRWPAGCTTDQRPSDHPARGAQMVGGESSGPETGRGDQDEIHHHVVDDVAGQDGPPRERLRLPSASRIHGDHLSLLRVSEVVE